MVQWEPGFPLSLFTDPEKVTASEASMLDRLSLNELRQFSDIRNDAFDVADEQYPPENPNDTLSRNDNHNDAFRHAYWSALLAREFGPEWADQYTTAHERVPGNEPQREAMDLHNNSVGIQIVRDNPDASPDELAQLIRDAVDNGEMVVVDSNGDLAYSDQVAVGETGHPAQGQEPLPGQDPGKPDADAES